MSDCFIAEIRMVGFTFSPLYWSVCAGQNVSISQNSALFALIGTSYGGDGRVSMGLPNLVGRAPLHYGFSTGPGQPPYYLGELGGQESVVMNHTNLPVHKHEVYGVLAGAGHTDVPNSTSYLGNSLSGSNPYLNPAPGASGSDLMAIEVLKTKGSNQAAPNQQPFLVTNFIIALEGTFPSRN